MIDLTISYRPLNTSLHTVTLKFRSTSWSTIPRQQLRILSMPSTPSFGAPHASHLGSTPSTPNFEAPQARHSTRHANFLKHAKHAVSCQACEHAKHVKHTKHASTPFSRLIRGTSNLMPNNCITFKFVSHIIRGSPLGQSQVQSFICNVLSEAFSEHLGWNVLRRQLMAFSR